MESENNARKILKSCITGENVILSLSGFLFQIFDCVSGPLTAVSPQRLRRLESDCCMLVADVML